MHKDLESSYVSRASSNYAPARVTGPTALCVFPEGEKATGVNPDRKSGEVSLRQSGGKFCHHFGNSCSQKCRQLWRFCVPLEPDVGGRESGIVPVQRPSHLKALTHRLLCQTPSILCCDFYFICPNCAFADIKISLLSDNKMCVFCIEYLFILNTSFIWIMF